MISSSRLFATVAVGVLLNGSYAIAGFNWDPSVRVEHAQERPIDIVETEVLPPVTEVVPMVNDAQPVNLIDVASLHDEAIIAENSRYDVVEGFGRDVPLSYALTSIVPSGYGYAFGSDVNPALPITWKGGKPWNQVLLDAVRDQGLFIHIDAQKVSIQKAAETKGSAIPSPKTSRQFASVISETPTQTHSAQSVGAQSVGREVFVRRGKADREFVANETVKTDLSVPPAIDFSEAIVETPVMDKVDTSVADMINETVVASPKPMATQHKEVIIERVNPDIPADVAAYVSPSSSENVFEMVMSTQSNAQVLDTKKVTNFHAKAGRTVREVLETWSQEANVQLYWETPYDFPVEKSMALTATYPMAVQALLGRYENVDPRPTVKLHPNWPHGPSILTVK